MAYSSAHGRKPYERASKIAHTDIINDPAVMAFVQQCALPSAPSRELISDRLLEIPNLPSSISTVIAIDGGLTETYVRDDFPSASIAFVAIGPLLLKLTDLHDVDAMPFIGPEDMARLKNIQRYSFAFPTKGVRYGKGMTFAEGVRATSLPTNHDVSIIAF